MHYAISDIHGECELFLRLMDGIAFSDSDTLYVFGDMIDKGRESVRLLQTLVKMKNARIIIGNHEKAFLDLYHARMEKAGNDASLVLDELRAYFPYDGGLLDWDTVDALDSLPTYIEEREFIGVHAGVPLLSDGSIPPLGEVPANLLLHDRRFKEPSVLPRDPRCVFFGHTSTSSALGASGIVVYRRAGSRGEHISDFIKIHLDTGVFDSGTLGCFCIDNCYAHYVNKR